MNIDEKIKPVHAGKPFVHHIEIKTVVDDDPDISYLQQNYKDVESKEERCKYLHEDEERLKDFYAGRWNFIGITTIAIVYIPIGKESFKIQEISSGGLWGIESDSSKEYLDQIKQEQLNELRTYLKLFHVDIPDDVEIIDEY